MGRLARAAAAAMVAAAAAVAAPGCGEKEEAYTGPGGEWGTTEDSAAILRKIPGSASGGPASATTRLVRDAKAWEALWKQVNSHITPPSKAPAVDFEKEMVAFVGLGAKPTAGWSTEVVGARVVEGKLQILWSERGPAEESMSAAVVTSPWHAVVLAKSNQPLEWKKYEGPGAKTAKPTQPPPKPTKPPAKPAK